MDGDNKSVPTAGPEEPIKYIRTFAGDAAALKKGGMPDMVPFDGDAAVSIPVPPHPESFSKPVRSDSFQSSNKVHKDPSLNARPQEKKPIVQPIPPPPPIITHPVVPSEALPSPIETYASDFSDRISEEHASPLTVLAAEQDSRTGNISSFPKKEVSRGSVWYAIISIGLLLIGSATVYIAYSRYSKARAPVFLASPVSAPIFVDERQQISGTGAVLEQAIEQSVASPLASGTVRMFYSTDATTTSNNIFLDLQLPAPGILLRNIVATGGMAGVVHAGSTQSPFFILSVTSYTDTFAGMLSWESSMPSDLSGLFPAYSRSTATSSTPSATTTSQISNISNQFVDKVVANHNVREYLDTSGRMVLLYGYWNQSTLIITRNVEAFTEIVSRLATSRS